MKTVEEIYVRSASMDILGSLNSLTKGERGSQKMPEHNM